MVGGIQYRLVGIYGRLGAWSTPPGGGTGDYSTDWLACFSYGMTFQRMGDLKGFDISGQFTTTLYTRITYDGKISVFPTVTKTGTEEDIIL